MIIQLTNIATGFILAAPKLQEYGGKKQIETIINKLSPYLNTLGIVELVIGIVALIERMGIVYFHIPDFGSSYPQALPAIAIGLIMSANYFKKYPSATNFITSLKAYSVWIGLTGILVGLGSILFGCVLCVY